MTGQLIDHLWQSTVFAAAVALLTQCFRSNRAGVRFWLWLSASLKFLVPFAVLIGLGARIHWAPPDRVAPQAVSYAVVKWSQPFTPMPAAPKDWRPVALAGVWACGFAAVAMMRFRAWRRVRSTVRASARLEIPAAVEVRSAPGLLEPGIVGVFRPALLLPEGIAERLTPDQLEAVLAHELCHVRRRDNLTAALHMTIEALFWFHPMVWWIGARLVEERERACDERVMQLGREPRIYADAILSVCRMYVESPLPCVAGVTGADLKKRVEAIMANRIGLRLNRAKRMLLAAATLIALTAPLLVGLFVNAANAPLIQAQTLRGMLPAPGSWKKMIPAPGEWSPLVAPVAAQAQDASARHFVMVFDFGGADPANARNIESALNFVRNMTPADIVAVMRFDVHGATLVSGFTQDKAALEAAIRRASVFDGPPPPGYLPDVAHLDAASRMLSMYPGEKRVLWYAGYNGIMTTGAAPEPAGAAAGQRGVIGGILGSVPAEEGTAQLGSAARIPGMEQYSTVMKAPRTDPTERMRNKYGPPDQIEDHSSDPQNPSQIWRYNNLADFGGRVEFQFPRVNGEFKNPRLNWPPPAATFEGAPSDETRLAEGLNRNSALPGASQSNSVSAGFPGRHASIQTYAAKDYRVVNIPLDGLSGPVDVITQFSFGQLGYGGRSDADASAGLLQTNLSMALDPGTYVYHILLRERATGRMFGEAINFQVK